MKSLFSKMASTQQRNKGIDFLRGFSILSVILLHCSIHMPFNHNNIFQSIYNIIFRSGHYGVMIFFVISGFLIMQNVLKRFGKLQDVSVKKFYQTRFARIVPCLSILLMILSLLDLLHISGFTITKTTLSEALFSAFTFHINWLEAKIGYLPANWDVLWSLSVEEMFYIFFPLACLLFKKPLYFSLFLLLFVVIGPLARVTLAGNEIWSDYAYLSCMDGIAIGCLSALICHTIDFNKKYFFILMYFGITLFLFTFIFRHQVSQMSISKVGLNITFLDISIGLILIAMVKSGQWFSYDIFSKITWNIPVCWFGKNSYEIYLIHSFFVISFSKLFFHPAQSTALIIFWYILIIILSGFSGQCVSTYFSEPMNKLIRNRS